MKSLYILPLLLILVVGISPVFGEMVSIETDRPEYYIGDEIKITVMVDSWDPSDPDIVFRIMTADGNNIMNIGQASHIEGNLYEGIITPIKESKMHFGSGEYILLTTRDSEEDKRMITLIDEQTKNPNRPKLTNEIEGDPIFGTACLAEGEILNDKGICVKEFPEPVALAEETVSLSQYEELQKENLDLKLENRQLKNEINNLKDKIIQMSDDFYQTIVNQMNWFQNSN